MDDASISLPADAAIRRARPLVSVLLPVFNAEKYLAAAIDSILRQTYRNLELIVIDDGSVDGSAGIISACADPRLVVIRNETNLGVVATLNKGLAHARGDLDRAHGRGRRGRSPAHRKAGGLLPASHEYRRARHGDHATSTTTGR